MIVYREPFVPERLAIDYSADELSRFQQVFQRAKLRYELRQDISRAFFVLLFLGVVLLIFLQKNEIIPVLAVLLLVLASLLVLTLPKVPQCPGCHVKLDKITGSFCPDCGQKSLQLGNLFGTPHCTACEKDIVRIPRRGRLYKIRYCNCCGLSVDKKGL